jgi:hemoglobin/transferrin/lactoferrin receptor protein
MYDLTQEWSIFGSWARTERLPTLDELYSSSTTQAPALTLEKEEAETFELGFAFSHEGVLAEGDALQFKLTAFRNDVDDLIQRTATTAMTYYENVGSARFEGVELEGGYEAEAGYARLAYSHVRGEDRDDGFTLSSTPADTLSLTLARRVPAKGLEFGWTGHFVDAITTSSRSTAGVITTTDYAAYSVHDLFLSWSPQQGAFEGSEIRVGVDNILDRTYRNNLDQENGLGRNVKLTLTRTF